MLRFQPPRELCGLPPPQHLSSYDYSVGRISLVSVPRLSDRILPLWEIPAHENALVAARQTIRRERGGGRRKHLSAPLFTLGADSQRHLLQPTTIAQTTTATRIADNNTSMLLARAVR